MSTVTLRTRGLLPMDWPSFAWLPLAGPSIRIEEFLDGKTTWFVRSCPAWTPRRTST